MEFLILFALAFGFYWLSGKYIDDVLESADDVWCRGSARVDLGRQAQDRRRT